jgi:4'-phosphopantetheinyl transferase
VWWAPTALARPWHRNLLDHTEHVRRQRLRFPADQDRFTVGVALLRLLTARRTGLPPTAVAIDRTCPTCDRPHGRPIVTGSGLHVSVSHSGAWVAVAVSTVAEVGVDVEHIGTDDLTALASRVLTADEASAIAGPADFYRFWTRKEALVKATGDGLSAPLDRVRVSPDPPRLLAYPGRPDLVAHIVDMSPGPAYAGAVAVLTGSPVEVVAHDATALLTAP